jgi:hypothetical protein
MPLYLVVHFVISLRRRRSPPKKKTMKMMKRTKMIPKSLLPPHRLVTAAAFQLTLTLPETTTGRKPTMTSTALPQYV